MGTIDLDQYASVPREQAFDLDQYASVPKEQAFDLDQYASVPKEQAFYEVPTVDVSIDEVKAETKNQKAEAPADALTLNPTTPFETATVPFEMPRVPHPELVDVEDNREYTSQQSIMLSSGEHSQPSLYYRLNTTTKGSQMLPAVINTRTRQRRGGCVPGCLITLILLLLILGGAWVFAIRPYAHSIAQTQLDNALTSAVNQLPSGTAKLPSGVTVPVSDNAINNLIVLNLSPSNPVQHPNTTITSQNIRLDFQLYGYPCAITAVPALNSGRLVVKNVGVEGIFALIMSPDEMTSLLNQHLNDAQNKLQRTVNSVQLKDHEVDLSLG
jgi:hypothetical protein